MANFFGATSYIGGGAGAVDDIDGGDLADADGLLAITATEVFSPYTLDATSGLSESSPDRIVPDANAGTKVWIVAGGYFANLELPSGTQINEFSTDGTLVGDSDDSVPTEKAVKAYVDAQILPAGMISPFAMSTPPSGWLECDGSSKLRASYANLFSAIGVVYGSADGTHFNLPDYRGKFLRGWDHGAGNDPDAASRTDRGDGTGADNIGSKQADAMQGHYHKVYTGYGYALSNAGIGTDDTANGARDFSDAAREAITDGANGTPRITSETRPLNINAMYCIKT